jgi:DNA-binding CsgD family transcriptional regulator
MPNSNTLIESSPHDSLVSVSGPVKAEPGQLIESLQTMMPQDRAANIGLAQMVDDQLWVACREPSEQTGERIHDLSEREYNALLLLAYGGMRYRAIGHELGVSTPTVRNYLHNTYAKLGEVPDGQTAATFLPMDKREIIKTNPSMTEDGSFVPDSFSPKEAETFRLIGQGLSFKQAAIKLQIEPSTARTHAYNMYDKLGITDRAKGAIVLSRLAGALPNLQLYVKFL